MREILGYLRFSRVEVAGRTFFSFYSYSHGHRRHLHAHIYTTLAISRSTEHLFIRVSINNISRDRGNCVLSREHEKCEQIEKDRMMNVSSVFLFACTSLSRFLSLSLSNEIFSLESLIFSIATLFVFEMSRLAVCTTRFESGR